MQILKEILVLIMLLMAWFEPEYNGGAPPLQIEREEMCSLASGWQDGKNAKRMPLEHVCLKGHS